MEGLNIFCESPDCGRAAKVFGIRDNLKIKRCEDHASSLIRKEIPIFSIACLDFITTLQDAAVFEERKSKVDKGRGNLTSLQAICDTELREALEGIEKMMRSVMESVESRFEEMKITVSWVCNERKKQLSQLEEEFTNFLRSKENQLSEIGLLLCADMPMSPRFLRFGIADVSDKVSAALIDSWTFATSDTRSILKCLDPSQKKSVISDALEEAANYADKGIPEALQYAETLISDESSLDKAANSVLKKLLKFKKIQILKNLNCLLLSWGLRHLSACNDQRTIEMGQKLASILYLLYGQFSEAEEILLKCYDIAQRENPASEVSMCLSNELCGLHIARAEYQKPRTSAYGLSIPSKLRTLPLNTTGRLYSTSPTP